MNPMLIYVCIRHNFLFLNTDFVGSINTRNICLILSTIYNFISVSVCIDMGLKCTALTGAYIADKTALIVRHSSFTLNEYIYRLYIAWYRPMGCSTVTNREKTLIFRATTKKRLNRLQLAVITLVCSLSCYGDAQQLGYLI